jgi:cytidylate kinase
MPKFYRVKIDFPMTKRIVIAIDGPAGAGKSTIARAIANRLGFVYIDTGAMYRAVALWALRTGVSESDMHRLEQLATAADISFVAGSNSVLLNGEDVTEVIRTPEVAAFASKISTVGAVRRALVEKQRKMAAEASVVMEGRDIGSVVFPDAQVKIFLDADPSIRADRRLRELRQSGASVDRVATAEEIGERDQRDRTRNESPMVQAPDAVYLDTSGLSVEEVEEAILKLVRERTSNGKEYSR